MGKRRIMSTYVSIKVSDFKPLQKKVFVTDLEHGLRLTRGGLILPDDNMSERGVHPRWGKVFAVGPDVDNISPGEWIYIKHGRWTTGIDLEIDGALVRIWGVEYPDSVEIISDTDPTLDTKHSF